MKKTVFMLISAIVCNDLISNSFLTQGSYLGHSRIDNFEEEEKGFLFDAKDEMIAVLDGKPIYYDQGCDVIFLIGKEGLFKTYKTTLDPYFRSQLETAEKIDKEMRKGLLVDYFKLSLKAERVMEFMERLIVKEEFFLNKQFDEVQKQVIDEVSSKADLLRAIYERKFQAESSKKLPISSVVAVASVVGLTTYLAFRK